MDGGEPAGQVSKIYTLISVVSHPVVATKVHVILRSCVVLTRMRATSEVV
jgi:hypothetical protein